MVCIFTHEKKECLRIDMRLNVPNPIVILHVLDSNLSNVSHEGVISKKINRILVCTKHISTTIRRPLTCSLSKHLFCA
jgi:hypothetical protein